MLTRQVGSLPLAKNAKHSSSIIYMYRRAGAHRTYAHALNLRETPTPFERMRVLSRCEDCRRAWTEGFCMCFLHTHHDKLGRSRSPTMHCILLVFMFVYNWRAGASQPSRTTGTIFLYIVCRRVCPTYRTISKCFYVNLNLRNYTQYFTTQ